ncbi:MAG: virulence RhuM family protein [Candidatus Altiarchaeota archaeon]|nr:virulence RhuM family protein [Candidatus Altiarchaeota archaeon]
MKKKPPANKKSNDLMIRNSTAEFLMFTSESRRDGLEVRFQDETVWLTQKLMAKLFQCSTDNISLHLKNIFKDGELGEKSVAEEFSVTASDGKQYRTKHYNLDAIIAVGYRVNSIRATQFRKWATRVLREFAIKGFVLDKERLKNEGFLGRDYFEELLEIIREIRASERRFYQKITDIYATALDYDPDSSITKTFFAAVQNKMHFATHGQTASEIIIERSDSQKPYMGLTTWKKAPKGKIQKSDVYIAKNYLSKAEIEALDRIVNMYLDYAEDQAKRKIPVTMEDWSKKLDAFLKFNERKVLDKPGKVSAEIAKSFAESEWEKYRIVQDRIFESDFDLEVKKLLNSKNKKT